MCESMQWVELSKMNEPVKVRADGQQRGNRYPVHPAISAVLARLECCCEWHMERGRDLSMHTSCHCRYTTPFLKAFRCGGMSVWPSSPSVWMQHIKQCSTIVSSCLPSGIQMQEDIFYQPGLHYSAVAELVCTGCRPAISCCCLRQNDCTSL